MPRIGEPSGGSYKPQAADEIARLISRMIAGQNLFDRPGFGGGGGEELDPFGNVIQGLSPESLGDYQPQITQMLQDPNNFAPEQNSPSDLDLLRHQLAQERTATAGPAAPDPLAQLLQQGQSLLGGGGTNSAGFDYESAKNDILGQISQAYNPIIQAIHGQNKHAKHETNRNQEQLKHLYGALARFDMRAGDKESARTSKEALALKRLGNRTQDQLSGVTDHSVDTEKRLLQGLGIEAAGSKTIAPLINEGQFQQDQALQSNAGAQRMTRGLGANQADYLTSLGSAAKLEGTNAQADALSQLQDYLANQRLSTAGILGQEAQARASALQNLAQMSLSAQASQANNAFSNWNDYFDNILASRKESAAEAYNQAKLAAAAKGTASSYLPKNYSDAFNQLKGQPELQSLLKTLMADPQIVAGQQNVNTSGGNAPITPEFAQQEIQTIIDKSGQTLTPQQLQLLLQAAYTLYS